MDQPDPANVATLTVSGGLLDGTEYAVVDRGRPVLIGSSMDADIQILLGNVEAAHACISRSAEGLTLSDVGSATGTFVNGDPIEGDRLLGDGDEISLGNPGAKGTAKLILRLRKGAPEPAAQSSPALDHAGAPPALQEHGLAPVLGDTDAPAFTASPKGLAPFEPPAAASAATGLAPIEPRTGADAAPKGLAPVAGPPGARDTGPAPAEDLLPKADSTLPMPRPSPHAPSRPAAAPPRPAAPPPRAAPAPPRPAAPPPPPPPAVSMPPSAHPASASAPTPKAAGAPPAYHSELPSVPPPGEAEPASAPLPLVYPPSAFPSLRPPAASTRPARRRSLLSLPSLPLVPLLGALAVLTLVGLAALTWRMASRSRPPELLKVEPVRTQAGRTLTLTGGHFASDPGANTVLFGAARGVVTGATPSELKVVVPAGARARVPVVVETRGGRSRPLSITVDSAVEATALEPDVAVPGQRILVRVAGLTGQKLSVEVAGMASPSVETVAEGVRAVIPDVGLPEGSRTSLVVRAGDAAPRSFELLIGRLPLVLAVSPAAGPVGELVTLQGRGFDADPARNAVSFAGEPGLVLTASRTELKVVVPASSVGDAQPDLPVVVKALGRTSTPRVAFRLVRSATAGFRPRFFPAPVAEYPAEPLVFVSSELGPVLLLGGAGESASVGERAMAVSTALNEIVDSATSAPVFEFRATPQPGVGLAGRPRTLLTPTAQDLAAYSKPWDGNRAAPPRRVTAAGLARHWAALLQDYLGLFLFRERPLQVLGLSTRGRVFGEIYAEANRRTPGEASVPSRLMLPVPAGWALALKQAALVVAEDGGRSAAAVVEGSWQGTIDDPEQGPRLFQVQLRMESGRLAGSLTTGAGSLELRAPLRDLEFARGTLHFTADLQGAAYRFGGTLQGNTLSGKIERPNRPPLPFTMQFLE